MTENRHVPLVSYIGVLWPGLLLLTLFSSTIIPGMREFIMGLGFGAYIGIWMLAVAPSAVLVWLGERGGA